MTESINSGRPKGFKTIAILGIVANTILLTTLTPIAIYINYANPERIPILRIMSLFSWFVFIPITIILLTGSIGLLLRQSWSRSLCIWALTADLVYNICNTLIDTLVRVMNWDGDTIYTLMFMPISLVLWVAEGAVLVYLLSPKVKQYLVRNRNLSDG